ncbi:hypothetical protein COTS27_01372 [Spirochaetota bacterium]|nr:hypothetical protein COTS27_01372 [Spirochaetota bacterium]
MNLFHKAVNLSRQVLHAAGTWFMTHSVRAAKRLKRGLLRLTWGNWALLVVVTLTIGSAIYGLLFLVNLIYDPEIAFFMSKQTLILSLVIPATLVLLNFAILFKILLERIHQKPGTSLRSKIISLFTAALIIPTLMFIFFFNKIFNFMITETLENKLLTANLENDLERHQNAILTLQQENEAYFKEFLATEVFASNTTTGMDIIIVFNAQNIPIKTHKKSRVKLKNYPTFKFEEHLPAQSSFFSSYEEIRGFVYTLHREKKTTTATPSRYMAGITFVPTNLKNEIASTLKIIRQVKQFELLVTPFKNLSIVLLIYLYIQFFLLTIIIFYYRSNKYLTPIGELIKSLQNISDLTSETVSNSPETLRTEARIANQIKRIDGNEIADLLRAFQKMRRHLRRNRARLNEILELKGWKTAATQLAHEIKNPLTPILLNVTHIKDKLIRKDFMLYEQLNDSFNLIEIEIKRISNLINEFATFSKESPLKLSLIEMPVLFQKLTMHLNQSKQITLQFHDHAKIQFYGDEEKIYRILINLSQNAIDSLYKTDHTPKILKISTQTRNLDDNRYYEITVSDNGEGIDPDIRASIFKPYITNKKSGFGLGLTICKQIAISHDGDIFLAPPEINTETQWTSFVLRIPLNKQTPAHSSTKSQSDKSLASISPSKLS